jgi:O-antigen/teichoic acid export membrane protein
VSDLTDAAPPTAEEPAPDGGTSDAGHGRLDRLILRGSLWTAVGYGVSQFLTFASVLVLVRLIEPRSFGLVALATPFLVALQLVQESGLGSALVHRRTEVERAAATVLVYSPLAATGLYLLTFAAAPFVASFVHEPALTEVLRVLGLVLVLRGLGIVPGALLERDMRFRARAKVDLVAVAAQVGCSIGLAVAGAEVWALVFGQLAGEAARSLSYWLLTTFRPNPRLAQWRLFREMASYGRFVAGTNVLNVVNTTADNVIVGRVLGPTMLGFYALAFRLSILPNSVIGYVVGKVMFSVYATLQSDLTAVRRVYLQNLQRIALFALPVSVGLTVAARPIVYALLGARWAPAIGPLRLLAVYGLVRSFVSPTGELFKGLGRPHLGLIFSTAYLVVLIPSLLLLVPPLGLHGAPLALLIAQAVASVPMFVTGLRLVRVGGRELFRALAPPAAAAGVLAVALVLVVVATRSAPPAVALVAAVVVGALALAGGLALFARATVTAMWTTARMPSS